MAANCEVENHRESETENTELGDEDIPPPDKPLPTITNEATVFAAEGSWEEITGLCEYFNHLLNKEPTKQGTSTENLGDWEKWRPRENENQNELKKKSASHASYEPAKTSKKGWSKSASRLDSSHQNFKNGKGKEGLRDLGSALFSIVSSLLICLAEAAGNIEDFVYRHVVTRTNAAYFDSDLLSANLEGATGWNGHHGKKSYKIRIKVHDEELRKRVSDELP